MTSTVIVFDAAGRREGGIGLRRLSFKVIVMESKLALPVFRENNTVRFGLGHHNGVFKATPSQFKWILNKK